MLLRESFDVALGFRLIFHVIYRLVRSIILLESSIFAWFVDKAKPVETFHIVGRFRPVASEIASLDDFIVFHEAFASADEEWHLYGFDGSFAWFVKCTAKSENMESMTRNIYENATRVARMSVADFLKESDQIPDNTVSISTLTSLDELGADSVLSRLQIDGVHVERDPPYLATLSFAISKQSGKIRRRLLQASLSFSLRFASEEKALVTIRSSLIDTLPLFSRIDLPCASFIVHPPRAGEAIERLLDADRDYLVVMTRLLTFLSVWILPHLSPALAIYGEYFLRIAPSRADEAALAVYCRFLQESSRLSLSAYSLFESALQIIRACFNCKFPVDQLADALGAKTRSGGSEEVTGSRDLPPAVSRSRLRALKRLALASIEDDLPWDDEDSPKTNTPTSL